MSLVIASTKLWHKKYVQEVAEITGEEVIYIDGKDNLVIKSLQKINPRYIFFPHWSYRIPAEIYENFCCVIFHMTDLPFGRGGSPLQNLISRGIYETKVSAIKCVKELDAGDIYLKRNLSLYGSAEEIYLRSAAIVKDMIIEIARTNPKPVSQKGRVTVFQRRSSDESNLDGLNELGKIFDYIRMLDADGYPLAFLETEHLRLEFSRASLRDGCISADVKIYPRVRQTK